MVSLRIPAATYRLQFNRQFRFAEARALVPYLDALGVTDLYASPLLGARRGSFHGYDVTDPTRLNPVLGDEEAFVALTEALQQCGMGLLLDIVPNHMAASSENPWCQDVLRNGRNSSYATHFDIDWRPARPGLANKILLPILGASYGKVLENQELTLMLAEDGFWVCYYEKRLPLSPSSSIRILAHWTEAMARALGAGHPAVLQLRDLLDALEKLPDRTEKQKFTAFIQSWKRFLHLYSTLSEVKAFVDKELRTLNGQKGDPRSFDHLDQILAEQAYRLVFWRVANEEINYRRFFDVSDLVAVRVEEEHVFEATHDLIFRLVEAGHITGLRIDHIDGLHDPEAYLSRLQNRLSGAGQRPGFYVVAEKILSGDEELPAGWQVYGTTGYDFLNTVNGLFVDERGAADLHELYVRLSGSGEDFAAMVYKQKRRVMTELFASEVRTLAQQLGLLAGKNRYGLDLTLTQLEQALIEVTACLSVYRTYTRDFTVTDRDRRYIEHAVEEAVRRCPAAGPACDFLSRVLLVKFPDFLTAEQQQAWLRLVMRWQQLTGPIMAKGFEDTTLYICNRLVSLNEVACEPQTMGISTAKFHRRNKLRQDRWPHTINASSTHDTKRSEDVRARINVLSEIPSAWAQRVERWRCWNAPKKPVVNGRPVPEGNTEYLIYQTLVGAWPLREEEIPAFRERLKAYLVKAAREAKLYTSWLDPNIDYENALETFAASILEPANGNCFFTGLHGVPENHRLLRGSGLVSACIAQDCFPGGARFLPGNGTLEFKPCRS